MAPTSCCHYNYFWSLASVVSSSIVSGWGCICLFFLHTQQGGPSEVLRSWPGCSQTSSAVRWYLAPGQMSFGSWPRDRGCEYNRLQWSFARLSHRYMITSVNHVEAWRESLGVSLGRVVEREGGSGSLAKDTALTRKKTFSEAVVQ